MGEMDVLNYKVATLLLTQSSRKSGHIPSGPNPTESWARERERDGEKVDAYN